MVTRKVVARCGRAGGCCARRVRGRGERAHRGRTCACEAAVREVKACAVNEQGMLLLALLVVALREMFLAACVGRAGGTCVRRGHAGGARARRTPAEGGCTRPGCARGARARRGWVECVPSGRGN